MPATILDGLALARSIRAKIAQAIQSRQTEGLKIPTLSVLLVGKDPASELYVGLKKKDCDLVGITCEVTKLPAETSEDEVVGIITRLNRDAEIDGILVQLPLPSHINPLRIIELITPRKDVDGVTPHNLGMLAIREPAHRCCTPKGVMTLIQHTEIDLLGLNATVIGASNHVGRPMALELLLAGCTVTIAHKYSRDTRSHVHHADIVVSATGQADLVGPDWIKPGSIVVDVGIEPQPDGSLKGDVQFEAVFEVAGWITPVPGGVGPMTRVSILQNLMDAVDRART